MQFFKLFLMLCLVGVQVSIADDVKSGEQFRIDNPGANKWNNEQLKEDVDSIREKSAQIIKDKNSYVNDKDYNRDPVVDKKSIEAMSLITHASREIGDSVVEGFKDDEKSLEPKVYVFVSFSMGEAALKNIIMQAYPDKFEDYVFVFRGWHPPDMYGFQKKIFGLMPAKEKFKDYPMVEVDPQKFRQFAVTEVPTFFVKKEKSFVRVVGGETFDDVIDRAEKGKDLRFGHIYGVDEPDLIAYMEKKAEQIDWDAAMKNAHRNMYKNTMGIALPQATENSDYLVDMTVKVEKDVKDTKGNALALAGQTINPLDYVSLTRNYIFFDASSEQQISVVRSWMKKGNAILMAGNLSADPSLRDKLVMELKQQIYTIDQKLIDRFKLTTYPSLAMQEGRFMKITTINPESVKHDN